MLVLVDVSYLNYQEIVRNSILNTIHLASTKNALNARFGAANFFKLIICYYINEINVTLHKRYFYTIILHCMKLIILIELWILSSLINDCT